MRYTVDSRGRIGPAAKEASMKRYPDIQITDKPQGCFPTHRDPITGGHIIDWWVTGTGGGGP